MSTELTFTATLADDLKSLRRDERYDGGPVVIAATAASDRGTPERTSPQFVSEGVPRSLDALARFPSPTVLAASGPLDATALTLCCACTVAYVDPAAPPAEIDPAAALALGLAGRLTERLGPGAAARILLGGTSSSLPGLAIADDDPLAAARATAARLAEPAGRLLVRSLAFAARSTAAQASEYDRELLALLPDREI